MNTKKIKKFLRAVNPRPKTIRRRIKNSMRAMTRKLEQDLYGLHKTLFVDDTHQYSGLLDQISRRHFSTQKDAEVSLEFTK